jgi:hypothetical protein
MCVGGTGQLQHVDNLRFSKSGVIVAYGIEIRVQRQGYEAWRSIIMQNWRTPVS